jgi:hypothetical protein
MSRPNIAVLIGFALLVSSVTAEVIRAEEGGPEVPAKLKVPPGHRLLLKTEGKGIQVYKAVPGKGGELVWLLEQPVADLFSAKGKVFGWQYEGPSWESADGSKVIGDKETVVPSDAPDPEKNVPWLLIKSRTHEGKDGELSKVTYIHRTNTKGGKAPAKAPLLAGTKVGIAYSADYYFYGKVK